MNLYREDPFGIASIVEPVIVAMGYELWGLECHTGGKAARVRVYIDRNAGVTLTDCSQVSEQVSAVLDVEDPIHMPYTLEISSPGINRSFFKVEQMQDAVGCIVKIKTLWPIEGRRNFSGCLESAGEKGIRIRTQEDMYFTVPLHAVKNAKLDAEIGFND